jgi:hypothetical protein
VVRRPHDLLGRPAGRLAVAGLLCAGSAAGIGVLASAHGPPATVSAAGPPRSMPPVRPTEPTPSAAPAPAGLPVIDYWTAPHGFPADPAPRSTRPVTEGLHPTGPVAVYDAPGGRPRARLTPRISGLPVTVPVVARRSGWFAVLLPTSNRTVGWLPPTGWVSRPLPDQLIVRRREHRLTWLHDGRRAAAWQVATGAAATPTPLGRTFVLGRTATGGSVYAGLDALALGSVPEDRHAVPSALSGAHTGIHGWYRDVFGRSVSNGCIRMPRAAQRMLLEHIRPGTVVTVVD